MIQEANHMKRILALALVAMMMMTAVMLTGCGDKKDDASKNEVTVPEGAVANTNNSGTVTSFYKNEYDENGKLLRNYD